ncbi:hypothetical protein A6R68_03621 [Neotoma lepida]|uniref:Laminin G domain-containing protein n=1 Tax=Neotoma lepida TaxID=56216 RepID=A0A1A6GNH9_NEOLE|nr:hypothetical protein A6R68_03621 [Neotoma lepida]
MTTLSFSLPAAREENVATFRGSEYLCYDLSQNPIQSSSDEITLSFKTWQRNGLILHTGKSADYVNLALKDGAVSLVINLGSGAFEAIVEPVNGKFNDNAWHDVKVTRNLRQCAFANSGYKAPEPCVVAKYAKCLLFQKDYELIHGLGARFAVTCK